MQSTYMDGSKGEVVGFELSEMLSALQDPCVMKVEVFNLNNLHFIGEEPPPLTRADVEQLIINYDTKKNIYKEYFELTGEEFKRNGLLEPPFMLNRKHY